METWSIASLNLFQFLSWSPIKWLTLCIMFTGTDYSTGIMRSFALSTCRVMLMLWQPGESHCPIVLGLLMVPLGQYQDLENISDFFTMAITGIMPWNFKTLLCQVAWPEIYMAQFVSYKTVQATSFKAGMWPAFWPVAGLINAWHQMFIFEDLALILKKGKYWEKMNHFTGL